MSDSLIPSSYICFFRHGERLDHVNCDAHWHDKAERPYDSPIVNHDLVENQAMKLKKYKFTRIVSSPLRRCIQTSKILSETLGIHHIEINNSIAEISSISLRSYHKSTKSRIHFIGREEILHELEREDIHLEQRGKEPPQNERYWDGMWRYRVALSNIKKRYQNENVIIVTHGAAFLTVGELTTSKHLNYSTKSSAFIIVDSASKLISSSLVSSISIPIISSLLIMLWVFIREIIDIILLL